MRQLTEKERDKLLKRYMFLENEYQKCKRKYDFKDPMTAVAVSGLSMLGSYFLCLMMGFRQVSLLSIFVFVGIVFCLFLLLGIYADSQMEKIRVEMESILKILGYVGDL